MAADQAAWRLSAGDSEVQPPAETFLAKLRRLFMGRAGQRQKRHRHQTKQYQCKCCFFVLVLIFVSSTVGCMVMWFTDLYLDSILSQMILRDGSEVYEAWKSPPVKPLICVHIYNYTNVDDYLNGKSEKIKIVDTGPYCYRETLEKTNIVFNDDGTVSYGDRRTHVFEENNSTGSMHDILVVPNLLMIAIAAMSTPLPMFFKYTTGFTLDQIYNSPMIKVTAHEFIFGYDDPVVSAAKLSSKFLSATEFLPFEKLGILAMRATETKDRITVKTGAGDLERMGVVTAVNGLDTLTAWDESECNRIDGSDGAFFPRHEINKTSTLYLFHKDLCRKLPLVYQQEVDFQDGVMGMRFHVPPNVYNTTGTCYCKDGNCPPEGVFDVSPCSGGVPLMMSFPHFLNADPSITEHLEGLQPDAERHDFFIDINPTLGFTLGTVSRIQINIQIKNAEYSSNLRKFTEETILPVVWFEITADRLPPDLFKMIYHASVTVQWIQWILQWTFLLMMFFSGCALFLCYYRQKRLARLQRIRFQQSESLRVSKQLKHREIIVEKLTSV